MIYVKRLTGLLIDLCCGSSLNHKVLSHETLKKVVINLINDDLVSPMSSINYDCVQKYAQILSVYFTFGGACCLIGLCFISP